MSKPSTHRSNAQQQRQRLGCVVIAGNAYAFSDRVRSVIEPSASNV